MDLGLKGKNAAITGSSQGIGNAIADSLAQEGCNVAISGRNQERLDQAVKNLVAKGIKAVGVKSGGCQCFARAFPGMSCLATSMQEQHQGVTFPAPAVSRDSHSV